MEKFSPLPEELQSQDKEAEKKKNFEVSSLGNDNPIIKSTVEKTKVNKKLLPKVVAAFLGFVFNIIAPVPAHASDQWIKDVFGSLFEAGRGTLSVQSEAGDRRTNLAREHLGENYKTILEYGENKYTFLRDVSDDLEDILIQCKNEKLEDLNPDKIYNQESENLMKQKKDAWSQLIRQYNNNVPPKIQQQFANKWDLQTIGAWRDQWASGKRKNQIENERKEFEQEFGQEKPLFLYFVQSSGEIIAAPLCQKIVETNPEISNLSDEKKKKQINEMLSTLGLKVPAKTEIEFSFELLKKIFPELKKYYNFEGWFENKYKDARSFDNQWQDKFSILDLMQRYEKIDLETLNSFYQTDVIGRAKQDVINNLVNNIKVVINKN